MRLNKIEFELSVIKQLQDLIKIQYGIYIEYDVILDIVRTQFHYIKYAMENNIDKINLITIATFKRSFIKTRYKEIKKELMNDGHEEEEAIRMAKEYLTMKIPSLTKNSNIKINNTKNSKPKVNSFPFKL